MNRKKRNYQKKKKERGKKKGKEREIVHCQRKKEVPKKKGRGEENNIIIGGAIKIVYFGLTLELQCP